MSAGSRKAADEHLSIVWPTHLPVVPADAELSLIRFLDSRGGGRRAWTRSEPVCAEDLPASERRALEAAAAAAGMALSQATSLRSQLYLSAAPWRFQGTEAASLARATALEQDVARFLARAGARFRTQEDMSVLQPGGTPDFLLDVPVRINGALVRWIEVKRYYGLGETGGLKPWLPVLKMQSQLERYADAFGEGALVLISGYSAAFASRWWPGLLLLDASAVDGVDMDALL